MIRGERGRKRNESSAQRLSASQRGASRHDQLCAKRSHRVLNAFRHHRGGHVTIGVGICGFGIGAQRLSASQRGAWTAWRAASGIGDASAQRLSASQRGASRAAGAGPQPTTKVLNAFRHHRGGDLLEAWLPSTSRCSTPFGITEGGIARHHRARPITSK